jgi:hypothetical protein
MNVFALSDTKFSNLVKNKYFVDVKLDDLNYRQSIDTIKNLCVNHEKFKKIIDNILTYNGDESIFLIKLIILYYNGGLFINDKIILENYNVINNLTEIYDICFVKSCLFDNLFDGFIIIKQYNKFIENIIINYFENYESLKVTANFNSYLYTNIKLNIDNEKILLLNEKIEDSVSNIYHNGNMICKHFFKMDSIEDLIEPSNIENKVIDLNNLKIGITLDVPSDLKSFYSNGIRQNTLYFYELLKEMKYDVKLIIEYKQKDVFNNIMKDIDFYSYEYSFFNNIYNDNYDLIFSFGFSFQKNIVKNLKKRGVKVVYYVCGNNYLIDSEVILYDHYSQINLNNKYFNINDTQFGYDEVWIIPQMYKQNNHYLKTLTRSKSIVVPFIWSLNSINFIKKILQVDNEKDLMYKKKHNKIAIMEPNLSVMKWCLPCLLICEMSHRKYKNITHLYVTNMSIEKTNKFKNFEAICKTTNLFNDSKITIESRYNVLDFMTKFADIIVSNQWENPLNYLYFDLAWMGWPILHNAYLCKNVGYYYEDFDYETASDKLNEIILHHDNNSKEYLDKNREIISKYLPTNIENQEKYRLLIKNLFA